jgi:hypothetical protein
MVDFVGDWADIPSMDVSFDRACDDIIEVMANENEYYSYTLDRMFVSLYNRFDVTKDEIGTFLAFKAVELEEVRRELLNEM